jgi:hypothetical protein
MPGAIASVSTMMARPLLPEAVLAGFSHRFLKERFP